MMLHYDAKFTGILNKKFSLGKLGRPLQKLLLTCYRRPLGFIFFSGGASLMSIGRVLI